MSTTSRFFESIKTSIEWSTLIAEHQFNGLTDDEYVGGFTEAMDGQIAKVKPGDLDPDGMSLYEKVKADMKVDPSRNAIAGRLIMLGGILNDIGKLSHSVSDTAKEYSLAYKKWIKDGSVGEFDHKIVISMDEDDKACFDSVVKLYGAAGIPASMLVHKVVNKAEIMAKARADMEKIIAGLSEGRLTEEVELSTPQ